MSADDLKPHDGLPNQHTVNHSAGQNIHGKVHA